MEIRRLDKIKILAFDYSIRWVDTSVSLWADAVGGCDRQNLVILLSTNQAEQQLKDTVLHEVIHALNYHLQLMEGVSDEDIARRLATGLLTVFRDNPELSAWIIGQK